jgi:hypothetical protein
MTEKEFVLGWTTKLIFEGIKIFPHDFIAFDEHIELKLPGKALVIGEEFFGSYEIHTIDGSSIFQAENYSQAKFILYANRNRPELMHIPKDRTKLKQSVSKYEVYLDEIIKKIEVDYADKFKEGNNGKLLVTEIFRIMNLVRY